MKDAYTEKIDRALKFTQNFHNRELVNQVLDEVEKILDDIERVLRKFKEGTLNCLPIHKHLQFTKITYMYYICYM